MWKALQHPEINLDVIAFSLKKLNYKLEFLFTPYWEICRNKVAKDHNFKCLMNYLHDNTILDVHHPTYDFHGYEAQNLDKLIPLCRTCHQNISDKNDEEKLKNIELQNNNQYIIKNPDIIVDSINKQAEVLRKVNFDTLQVIKRIETEEPILAKEVQVIVEQKTIASDDPLFHIKHADDTLSKMLERFK